MFTKVTLLAALAAAANALTISTPASLVECQPVQLSWTDGTAPYYPSIIPGGEASSAALVTFDTQSATTYTWTVNLASGTNV
ncbi:uncharacterized protein EHS24_008988 [Apiotrichum porosum]|uniref:Uncharacterized protein n=1 Tax=Apiotrichum porosum TaxID=105984 RepID=A0A427XNC1_9TREE|nr:uncharacterized protein EHS24_008988 [Apiotrichum porosum]RSH80411.1 hypothetical protein EHS24_008988 [Apiotrichum porosum]